MNPDNFAREFSEAVFKYLRYLENHVSDTTITEAFADVEKAGRAVLGNVNVFEFVTEAAKSVFVLSVTHPGFHDSMENYFSRNAMTRLSVFTFIAKYCFTYHAVNRDIFEVVLNTTAFVYKLGTFCLLRDPRHEFVDFAGMSWTEIFESDLKADFRAAGGWDQFRKYVAEKRYRAGVRQKARTIGLIGIIGFLEQINYLSPSVEEAQASFEALGVSFASLIPDLDKKLENILRPFEKANAKIVKLLEESRGKPSDQSSSPSNESSSNPELDAAAIDELSRGCHSLQLVAPDHCSNEPNSANEPSVEIQNDSKESLV